MSEPQVSAALPQARRQAARASLEFSLSLLLRGKVSAIEISSHSSPTRRWPAAHEPSKHGYEKVQDAS
jgi:hypothetical protein